jgi:prepilin-type N-terminal cleavage/methylation domain-containing protein
MRRFRSLRSEAGMTLVEVLVTISILGIAIVGIISGLASTSRSTYVHRKQVTADVIVRSYGEAIKEQVRLGHYVDCATGDSTSPRRSGSYNSSTIYTPPAGYVVSQDTPLYQDSSALNVVLVLDVSSSIANAGAGQDVRNAANGFLGALRDTGSRVAIVTFGTRSELSGTTVIPGVLAPPTADTTAENRPPPYRSNLAYLQSLVSGLVIPRSDSVNPPPQATNWDEGLMRAKDTLRYFPLGKKTRVFLVTDGNPNRYIANSSGLVAGSNAGPDVQTAVLQAKEQTTAIEGTPLDTKLFAVGVTSSPNVANLKTVTGAGPNAVLYDPPRTSFDDSDYMVTDFSSLTAALTDIAAKVSAETFTERCPTPDQGAQLLTLRATTIDGAHSERLQMVVRRP